MIIKIEDGLTLELLDEDHASAMFSLIDSNRQHLKEWLPWVDHIQTIENLNDHIADCKRLQAEGTDYAFAIMMNNKMVGRIGIHYIQLHNKIAALGYWLGDGYQGKGIITKACIALIDHCFNELGMNRVEIKCATGNVKSRAIPEKLNFNKEGMLRKAELVNGQFLDLYLYSMLRSEWRQKTL
ncbi:MAG: GNAT family protein [Ferruginibacter sp.]